MMGRLSSSIDAIAFCFAQSRKHSATATTESRDLSRVCRAKDVESYPAVEE